LAKNSWLFEFHFGFVRTAISEERIAYVISVKTVSKLEKLAVTSN
jgi:hypothetical protein